MDSNKEINRMERDFNTLSADNYKYLKYNYKDRLQNMRDKTQKNQVFLNPIVSEYDSLFKYVTFPNGFRQIEPLLVQEKDIIKMRSTIRQFVREWAKEVYKFIYIYIYI